MLGAAVAPSGTVAVEAAGIHRPSVGPDQEELVDSLFRLWIALAVTQGRGRRLAFRLLEG